jgi:hypothetical protein
MSNQSNITIKKFQIPLDISSKEIEKIKKLKANKPVSNWPKFYLNERVFKLKNPTRKRLVFNYKPVLDKLEDENNVFSLLLKSYVYLRIGNVARSEFLIDKILRMDISAQFLQFSQVELNEQRRKDVLNRILWVIKYFEDRFDNEIKVEMLKMVIARLMEYGKEEWIAKELDQKRTLQELRKIVTSPNNALRFPSVWFPVLYQRASFNEAIEFLEKSFEYLDLKTELKNNLWLFQIYLPRNEKLRTEIFKQINALKDSKNMIDKDLYFRLQENEVIRQGLSKNQKTPQKPIFIEKRNFYRKLLSEGRLINYSLYQLLKLGDEQTKYLLWAIL